MNLWLLSVLGIFILAAYIKYPSRFFLVILLIVIVCLLFYLWYGPGCQRKKNAAKIVKEKGEYRLTLTDSFIQFGENHTKWMWKDLKMTFYISENMYTLKVDRQVFAIPKRVLNEKEQKELVQIMYKQQIQFINVQIKKE